MNSHNRNAVAADTTHVGETWIGHNPVGVGRNSGTFSQGSAASVATLGWRTQSRWRVLRNSAQAPVVAEQLPKKRARTELCGRMSFGEVAVKLGKPATALAFARFVCLPKRHIGCGTSKAEICVFANESATRENEFRNTLRWDCSPTISTKELTHDH